MFSGWWIDLLLIQAVGMGGLLIYEWLSRLEEALEGKERGDTRLRAMPPSRRTHRERGLRKAASS